MTISLFNMSESFAAGFAKCDLFVKISDAAYAMVQGHPSCGLDPNDPRWKFPPSQDYEYRSFCAGALDDTIDQLTQQINDATNRCRVCSARLEQCEAQDYYAYIYHCVLKSENHVCDCYEGRHPPNYDDGLRDSAVSTYMVSRCVSVPFYFIDSPLKEKRCSEAVINTVDELDPPEKQELKDRNRELDQCTAQKQNQINFCNNYVDQTRKLVRTLTSGCDFMPTRDGRFSTNDDDRMFWCMGLTQSPAGDPHYNMGDNIDPVTF